MQSAITTQRRVIFLEWKAISQIFLENLTTTGASHILKEMKLLAVSHAFFLEFLISKWRAVQFYKPDLMKKSEEQFNVAV